MSQSPVTKFTRSSKLDTECVFRKHKDSPRPTTSADNLVCHALKKLKLQTGKENNEQTPQSLHQQDLLHKVPSPRRGRPTTYTFAEKMDALEQALIHGFSSTSQRLNIPCSTLSTWKKELVEGRRSLSLRSPLKGKRRSSLARKLTYRSAADPDDLTAWLSELRIKKKTVTLDQITTKIRSTLGEEAFQAKSGWLSDFLTRHGVSLEDRSRQAIANTDKYVRDSTREWNKTASKEKTSEYSSCVKQETVDLVDTSPTLLNSEIEGQEYISLR